MARTLRATFDGKSCMVEFSVVQGITPGTGTVTFADQNTRLPTKGRLSISDGADSVNFNDIYAENPRIEESATDGKQVVATIYDRRITWKWGWIVGIYNQPDATGAPSQEKTLQELFDLCFEKLEESNYRYFDLPTEVYPAVKWEYENPAIALNKLCEQFNLVIGMAPIGGGTIVISAYDNPGKMPGGAKSETMESISNRILPRALVLVGNRTVNQQMFIDLIPVGVDTDGFVKNISELTYAPSGATLTNDEAWGREAIAMFSNLTEEQRELADKCIFKWYAIDPAVYTALPKILPLLTRISAIVTIEGVDQHDKPYIEITKTVWDGSTFKAGAAVRVNEGYTVDRDLGIVKFGKMQYKTKTTDNKATAFTRAKIDLIAAFERKEGDYADFAWWERTIAGSAIPVVYRDKSMTSYWIRNENSGQYQEQNRDDLDKHANKVLDKLVLKYSAGDPKVYTFAGVARAGVWGQIKSATWRMGDDGAETVVQEGIELTLREMPTYTERLNKRKLQFLLGTEA